MHNQHVIAWYVELARNSLNAVPPAVATARMYLDSAAFEHQARTYWKGNAS